MAGATGSDQAIHTGRTNRAEGRTVLWAQVPPGQGLFNGDAILIVEAAKNAEDPDDYEDGGTFRPANKLHGIVAVGYSSGSPSNLAGTPGAAGVIGRGGNNQGTGVVGLGGGVPDDDSPETGNGAGGIGVHGLGGSQAPFLTFADPSTPPGAGVIGQGGRRSDHNNTLRLPHAPGVIGLGGGIGPAHDSLLVHTLTETGGIGVYAQGAEATVSMVPPPGPPGIPAGPNVPSGPLAPAAGVLGRGGVPIPPRGPVAAGVIGLAGGVPIPDISESGDTGVYGTGPTGVTGRGVSTGVHGVAVGSGRGGMFESVRSAQVQLVPQKVLEAFPTAVGVTPLAIPRGSEGAQLPKDGQAGDLLSLMDKQQQCTLWFCVGGPDKDSAQWAQVLLGPSFPGVA